MKSRVYDSFKGHNGFLSSSPPGIPDGIREMQHLGGHCMVNFVRGRGIAYAALLDMLVEHFDLGNNQQRCGAVVELEALLVR